MDEYSDEGLSQLVSLSDLVGTNGVVIPPLAISGSAGDSVAKATAWAQANKVPVAIGGLALTGLLVWATWPKKKRK